MSNFYRSGNGWSSSIHWWRERKIDEEGAGPFRFRVGWVLYAEFEFLSSTERQPERDRHQKKQEAADGEYA
jgi:hypothetical protein